MPDADRFQRATFAIEAPNEDEVDRQALKQLGSGRRDSLANFDVTAGFTPNVEKQRSKTFHV
jgi:hypothetical protein